MLSRYQLRIVLPALLRSRFVYLWSIRTIQLCLFVASTIAAFLLRFDFSVPDPMKAALWAFLCAGVPSKIVVFHLSGLGRGMWRYFATPDLGRVAAANAAASSLAFAVLLAIGPR